MTRTRPGRGAEMAKAARGCPICELPPAFPPLILLECDTEPAERGLSLPKGTTCHWMTQRGSNLSPPLNSHVPFLYPPGSLSILDR